MDKYLTKEENVYNQYGATRFLSRVAEKVGLADLRNVFGGNMMLSLWDFICIMCEVC